MVTLCSADYPQGFTIQFDCSTYSDTFAAKTGTTKKHRQIKITNKTMSLLTSLRLVALPTFALIKCTSFHSLRKQAQAKVKQRVKT